MNGGSQRRSAGRSLLVVACLAGFAALAVTSWLLRDLAGQDRETAREQAAEAVVTINAAQLSRHMADEQALLARIAADPAIRMQAREASLPAWPEVAAVDGGERLVIVSAGIRRAAPFDRPAVGYALLDMLRRAERSGEVVPAEVHLLAGNRRYVQMVHPLELDGEVAAHLLLRHPLEWLEQRLVLPAAGGSLRLLQQVGDGAPVRVLSLGAPPEGEAVFREPVPGTPWSLVYTPPPPSPPALSSVVFPVLAALGGLLLAVLVFGLWGSGGRRPAAATAPDDTGPAADSDFWQGEDTVSNDDALTPEEATVSVDPGLFRAYDIRGVVGRGLSAEVVQQIGRAIGSEAVARGQGELVVGRDGRLSSPDLAAALIRGLRSTGVDVVDLGQVPTPVMYFATYHLGTGSGVVVTGSHNPPDYNGMKIMLGGETLSGEAITALYRRLEAGDLVSAGREGALRQHDVVPDYLDRILGDVRLHRPLRVVVDCGNGVAGGVAPRLLEGLGCELEELYCTVDGTFPNHHPDPADPHNLEELIQRVLEGDADVGLAFDGDGDRLGVVDSGGKIIWPDRQMMLYAREILARQPGADIIFDVKCSAHLARIITENAGVPVMWQTGHSIIKAKLKATGAPLAGEMSGHIFFNDRWDGFDDGLYTAARLLEILALDPRSSSEVFAELPETVSTPELKVNLEEGEPPRVIQRLLELATFPDARVTTIDGLRVDFSDGWGLVRASNTTPCLVLRFEADDETALERIKRQFRELLEQARPGLVADF